MILWIKLMVNTYTIYTFKHYTLPTMRTTILFVLFVCCFASAYAQLIGDFYPGGKPRGKVVQITFAQYNRNHTQQTMRMPDTTMKDTTWYDEHSNAVSRHLWPHYGAPKPMTLIYYYTNRYNSDGKLTETHISNKDRTGTVKYDENGVVAELNELVYNENSFTTSYTYDDKHQLVESDLRNTKLNKGFKTLYKYNKKNLITEEYRQGPFPAHIVHTYQKFDRAGNWTRKITQTFSTNYMGSTVIIDTVDRKITYN